MTHPPAHWVSSDSEDPRSQPLGFPPPGCCVRSKARVWVQPGRWAAGVCSQIWLAGWGVEGQVARSGVFQVADAVLGAGALPVADFEGCLEARPGAWYWGRSGLFRQMSRSVARNWAPGAGDHPHAGSPVLRAGGARAGSGVQAVTTCARSRDACRCRSRSTRTAPGWSPRRLTVSCAGNPIEYSSAQIQRLDVIFARGVVAGRSSATRASPCRVRLDRRTRPSGRTRILAYAWARRAPCPNATVTNVASISTITIPVACPVSRRPPPRSHRSPRLSAG